MSARLDPVILLRDIRAMQERLATLRRRAAFGSPAAPSIELFLASLRTAWEDGAARPTDRPPVKAKRERRRPDPLVEVTPLLRQWFNAEPWRTGSELCKAPGRAPRSYPDSLLRTVQRRLKTWRGEEAAALLFGSMAPEGRGCQFTGAELMRPLATQRPPATRPASSAPKVREQNR